ncbi:hypothetical protein STENM36S_02847 [Streptomyces tendae]
MKRNFSFVYHREDEPTRPEECTQYPTWGPPLGPDSHYFRQDVDAYMFHVAVSYGVTAYTHTMVDDVKFEEDGATLVTRNRGSFRASYVVDAGGMRAMLPERLGLRQEPPYRTRSRTIFTHMVDVRPFDAVSPPREQHGMPSPFSQGTLHHMFQGGWLWVIPFDNQSTSTSELCSVGINLDLDQYPRPDDISAEDEFWHHVRRFPSVARQFERARAVRPYVSTDRTQFASQKVVGDRWCLLPHASDFIDPLFSSGLAVTATALRAEPPAHRRRAPERFRHRPVRVPGPLDQAHVPVLRRPGVLQLHRVRRLRPVERVEPGVDPHHALRHERTEPGGRDVRRRTIRPASTSWRCRRTEDFREWTIPGWSGCSTSRGMPYSPTGRAS